MSIISPFTAALRSVLGVAEHEGVEAAERSPLHATVAAEETLDHLAGALARAGESADRQVELLDGVARALPALIEQVTALSAQVAAMNAHAVGLNQELEKLVTLLEPLADAERDVSRFERLFRRQRQRDDQHAGGSRV